MENKKLSQEEIDNIKTLQNQYNKVIFELGSIEGQLILIKKQTQMLENEKNNISNEIDKIGEEEKKLIDSLQTKYGAGNINIETGEIIPL
jgi:chromosome segregation ATPase